MKLLIVESPGKIKKIKSILGADWNVAASIGHIRDLPKDALGIDKEKNYKMLYAITPDKRGVVAGLKNDIKQVGPENVYLATDEDREGEAISFHLCQALNLDYKTTKRVTFNEITEEAVLKAVANFRTLDLNLVAAQEGRRAIDRLVGYQISPVLWKKLALENSKPLSAGRVQSIALKLIVEREQAINAFKSVLTPSLSASFKTVGKNVLNATYTDKSLSFDNPKEFLSSLYSLPFRVTNLEKKPHVKTPSAPFSTSTLQQDASKKLKVSVDAVMKMAQKLYEDGFITYMRTDSVNISQSAVQSAKAFIVERFGKEYFFERSFKNKNENAQEAHEAIRPTDFSVLETSDPNNALYQLIRSRALASQMADLKGEKTEITIGSENHSFKSSSILVSFDGFTIVYNNSEEEDQENPQETTIKENILVGDPFECLSLELLEKASNPPKRYDQAALVKALEEKGIGRPATYASIISTILSRDYVKEADALGTNIVVKLALFSEAGYIERQKKITIGSEKRKLLPTTVGKGLCQFLCQHFSKIMDYQFTANMEDQLDTIAQGKINIVAFVSAFDLNLLEALMQVDLSVENVVQKQERIFIYNDHQVKAAKGKFGFYLSYKEVFYSIKQDPYKLNDQELVTLLEEAIKDKEAQLDKNQKALLKTIGKYQVKTGQYGIYITDGKNNATLPKDKDYKTLQEIDCKTIIEQNLENKKKAKVTKKK